jgi:outer membrane protein assembly factor BamB
MLLARTVRVLNNLAADITQKPVSEPTAKARTTSPSRFLWGWRVWGWRALILAAGAGAAAIGFLTAGHPYSPPLPPGAPSPVLSWVSSTGNYSPDSDIAVADGIVYVECENTVQGNTVQGNILQPNLSSSYSLYAINAGNGHVRWIRPMGSSSSLNNSGPAVANGLVYIGAGDGRLYALNAATGIMRWSYDTGSSIGSTPILADGTIYFGNDNSWMYALNAANGHVRWAIPLRGDYGGIETRPAIAGTTLYVLDGGVIGPSKVYALNVANGKIRWSIEGSFESNPSVLDGMVFVSGNQFYALNAANGHIRWVYKVGGSLASPVAEYGMVYAGGDNGTLYAFNASTGRVRWSYTIPAIYAEQDRIAGVASVIFARNTLYVGGFDGVEYALTATNGSIRWAFYNVDFLASPGNPAFADGTVYMGTSNAVVALSR